LTSFIVEKKCLTIFVKKSAIFKQNRGCAMDEKALSGHS